MVVLCSFCKLAKNEVELGAVVVDIRIVFVLFHGLLEVIGGSFAVAYNSSASSVNSNFEFLT